MAGFHIMGVRQKAICTTLATIGGMSRKRVPNAPSIRLIAIASTPQSATAGSRLKQARLGVVRKIANTTTMTTMLCASTMILRSTARAACSESGMRMARIMPSDWVKQTQPSEVMELMKVHSTSEMERNGR